MLSDNARTFEAPVDVMPGGWIIADGRPWFVCRVEVDAQNRPVRYHASRMRHHDVRTELFQAERTAGELRAVLVALGREP